MQHQSQKVSGHRNAGHRKVTPSFRRLILATALLVTTLTAVGSPASAHDGDIRDITLPVPIDSVGPAAEGGVYWSDTYGACRGSGCSRSHEGVDMLGPKLTPLLAVADGWISWMRHDDSSGNNLIITDDDGWSYHYIHINNDSPGTDDGANPIEWAFSEPIAEAWTSGDYQSVRVSAGDLVAYMGDSGNAEAAGSHLHFEIVDPDGVNINPTPSVDAALEHGAESQIVVPIEQLGPYATFPVLVDDLYSTLQGRSATAEEAQALADSLVADGFQTAVEPFITVDSLGAQIDRLYMAFFLRLPDFSGYDYWIDTIAGEASLVSIAEGFALSEEFDIRYGGKEFGEFLDQLYSDVLLREPDEAGKAYWLDKLETDPAVTRGSIVVLFSESAELRASTNLRSEFVALTALLEDRMPSSSEINDWVALRGSMDLSAAIAEMFLTDAG